MSDNKLIKPPNPSKDESPKGIQKSTGGAIKVSGRSRLHQAIANANASGEAGIGGASPEDSFRKAAEAATRQQNQVDKLRDPLTAENRIAIMADCSGSMSSHDDSKEAKIDLLKIALDGFMNHVNFDTTSVAIYTFPFFEGGYGAEDPDIDQFGIGVSQHGLKYKLSFNKILLDLAIQGLHATGGTPMAETMSKVITDIPLTRGIIISDGKADVPSHAITEAKNFAKSETPVDCVHIGTSSSGEDLLSNIAKLTGGIYIKFDKVENFAKSFAFLTPEGRATLMLTGASGTLRDRNEVAKLLGAKEVK